MSGIKEPKFYSKFNALGSNPCTAVVGGHSGLPGLHRVLLGRRRCGGEQSLAAIYFLCKSSLLSDLIYF